MVIVRFLGPRKWSRRLSLRAKYSLLDRGGCLECWREFCRGFEIWRSSAIFHIEFVVGLVFQYSTLGRLKGPIAKLTVMSLRLPVGDGVADRYVKAEIL